MSLRATTATWLGRFGVATTRARWLKRHNRTTLRILAYHRVLEMPDDFTLDPGLVSATPDEFRRQMEFVHEHFTAISFADLARIVDGTAPAPPNPIIITFDDGYRDNFTTAYPTLRELGLPATIFLVTGHISTAKMFWWDKIVYVISQTRVASCRLNLGGGETSWPLAQAAEREQFCRAVLRRTKTISEDERQRLVSALAAKLQVATDFPRYEEQLLTWEQVQEMAQHGIEFGSHTRTHPVLANVSPAQLRDEVEGSSADMTQRLGQPPNAIAYPAGKAGRYNDAVLEAVRAAGYRFGVSYDSGINDLENLAPVALRRIAIESDDTLEKFMARVTLQPLA